MNASDSRPGLLKNKATLLLGVALLLAALAGGTSTDMAQLHRLGARPPLWGFHPRPEQLLLPLFLHYGWVHWTCNFVLLLVCSLAVETVAGAGAVLFVFFGAGISSLLVSLVFHPQLTSVGCSGAVFGLWLARLVDAWWPPAEPDRWRVTALAGVGLALTLLPGLRGMPVDHWGHLGGALAGGVAFAAYRAGKPWRILYAVILLAAAGWVARPPYAPDFSGITL